MAGRAGAVAPRPAPPRGHRRPGPRPRALAGAARPARARVRAGWLLIPLVALLLGGVVWVNVARLQVTTRTSAAVERYRTVQSEIVRLRARLAQRDGDVIDQARRRLGMVQAPSKDVTYLRIAPPEPPPSAPAP